MRTVVQVFILFALALALPNGATPTGGGHMDVNIRTNRGASVGGAVEVAPRAPFLDLSYIFGGAHNKDDSSVSDMVTGDQTGVASEPSPLDFWELAKESEKTLQDYVHHLLETAATYFDFTGFTDIPSTMSTIISTTATFRDNIDSALNAHNVTFDVFSQEVESIFMEIWNDLETFPSLDDVPGHTAREEMVDQFLNGTTQEFTKLAIRYGIEEGIVTTYLVDLKPQVLALIVTVGDINEQCPQLFPAVAFSVAVLLVPEMWLLRPLLSCFGFGPMGPIKGSAAALWQSHFWGAAVKSGSWFSWLQAAGMGAKPEWAELITKVPVVFGGLMTGLLSCFGHE